jgi:uncharacterized protein
MICCWRIVAGAVVVAASVHPNSRRPGLHGVKPGADGPRLHIAVSDAAEHGDANRAACALLAQALGVASSDVCVRRGAASRRKQIHLDGEPGMLCARLMAL